MSFLSTVSSLLLTTLTYNVKRHPAALVISVMIFEAVASFAIIELISYTEIDWIAYMQEVGGVINDREFDYTKLRGDTGPLVYPAGFVYIYSILYYLTNNGNDIFRAQIIFIILHMVFVGIFIILLIKNTNKRLPLWVVVLTILSRRIHSIFVLRLFNDCWAVMFCYLSLIILSSNKITKDNVSSINVNKNNQIYWYIGSIIYSFAVSIKMNILLYSPAIGLLYYKYLGFIGTVKQIITCVIVQLIVGLPFLSTYPVSYITRAFNFGKDFEYKWTVNFKFISQDLFLNKKFGFVLLLIMILVILNVAQNVWCHQEGGLLKFFIKYVGFPDYNALTLEKVNNNNKNTKKPKLNESDKNNIKTAMKRLIVNDEYFLDRMFLCNYIGIVFAKSLHFQFYVWYYHTIPYLAWRSSLPLPFKILLVAVLELIWNIFPSRAWTSATLWIIHLILLTACIKYQFEVYSKKLPKLKTK